LDEQTVTSQGYIFTDIGRVEQPTPHFQWYKTENCIKLLTIYRGGLVYRDREIPRIGLGMYKLGTCEAS